MAANTNLQAAKAQKNDEFYTRLEDVEAELQHYTQHFRDAVIYCNCDDPVYSNFWKYFHLNFAYLGLRKLISTHFDKEKPTYKLEYTGGNDADVSVGVMTHLQQNGDFRSPECIELLKEATIVVTNPPFSQFRDYVNQLMEYGKKFIIIGNKNAITYKEFFPLLKENKVWIGYNAVHNFMQPDGSIKKFGNIGWYTNLDIKKRHEKLVLWKKYTPEEYPRYDNYDAINVDKVSEIPCDYEPCWYKCEKASECPYALKDGMDSKAVALCETPCNGQIGVPITYMDRHNSEQCDLVAADFEVANPVDLPNGKKGTGRFYISDDNKNIGLTQDRQRLFFYPKTQTDRQLKRLYTRLIIRKKKV